MSEPRFGGIILNPILVAAGLAMTTDEQDRELAAILERSIAEGDPLAYSVAVSRFLIDKFGLDKLNAATVQGELLMREVVAPMHRRHSTS